MNAEGSCIYQAKRRHTEFQRKKTLLLLLLLLLLFDAHS
jgi:hypothetical protein